MLEKHRSSSSSSFVVVGGTSKRRREVFKDPTVNRDHVEMYRVISSKIPSLISKMVHPARRLYTNLIVSNCIKRFEHDGSLCILRRNWYLVQKSFKPDSHTISTTSQISCRSKSTMAPSVPVATRRSKRSNKGTNRRKKQQEEEAMEMETERYVTLRRKRSRVLK